MMCMSTVLHYDGIEWTSFAISGTGTGTKGHYYGVWGSAGNDVFVMGERGSILHYNGIEWKTLSVGRSKQFYGVCGRGDFKVTLPEKSPSVPL